jgi:RNA polymerase sigma factor (sigma-70 family)
MDVNADESTLTAGRQAGSFGFDRLAQLLGGWQAAELRAARGFPECRGLSAAQLEDLYQDTALALLSRSYASEEHLRNALRHGMRRRALNMHRDQRRRREILAEHAPTIQREAEATQTRPEDAALAAQDRLLAKEFLAELEPLERQVFALSAEGLRYRAIATALRIPVNEARTAARSCERKRARFQLLYETGRLCGYRAAMIATLKTHHGSRAAVEQAKAHLAACSACRTALGGSAGQPTRRAVRAGALLGVLSIGWGWLRRATGAGGLGAKATAAVITAAVVAGGTLGADNGRHPHRPEHPQHRHVTRAVRPPAVPWHARRDEASRSTTGAERHAGRHAEPSRPSSRVAPVGGQLVAVPEEPAAQADAAQREFGLEQ